MRCSIPQASNFLAAIAHPTTNSRSTPPLAGLAWVDVSTGRFSAASFPLEAARRSARPHPPGRTAHQRRSRHRLPPACDRPAHRITRRPAWTFGHVAAVEVAHQALRHPLARRLRLRRRAGRRRCGRASRRRRDPQLPGRNAKGVARPHRSLHRPIPPTNGSRSTPPRAAAWSSSPRSATAAAKARCSASLDRTVTSLGARLLADWLAAPLTDVAAINARLDAVAELVANADAHGAAPRIAPRDLRHPAAAGSRHHRPRQSRATSRSSAARWPACRK